MLVTCKCHGQKIDRDTAFKVVKETSTGKKQTNYYCSQEIYEEIFIERERRDSIPKIVRWILGGTVSYALFKPQILRMFDQYSSEEMLNYLEHEKDRLAAYLARKDFDSDRAKVGYLLAILRSDMKTWSENKQQTTVVVGFDCEPVKYVPRKRKPTLEEYEDGDDEI